MQGGYGRSYNRNVMRVKRSDNTMLYLGVIGLGGAAYVYSRK
jgi:hypothetical protein